MDDERREDDLTGTDTPPGRLFSEGEHQEVGGFGDEPGELLGGGNPIHDAERGPGTASPGEGAAQPGES